MSQNIHQLFILRRILIYVVSVAVALTAGILAGSSDYRNLGVLAGLGVTALLAMAETSHLPVLIMLSMMPGRGLLLGGMGYWDAFAIIVVVSVMLRQLTRTGKVLPMTGRGTWLLTAVFCSVFVGHVAANSLGAGTGSEGGYQTALVAVLTILIGRHILTERLSFSKMGRMPRLGLIPGFFEGAIELTNYLWPAAIAVTYVLYSSSLNWETLVSLRTGAEVSRLAGLRTLGCNLALLCSVGIVFVRRLVSWRGVVIGVGLLCSLGLVLAAGYRSYVGAVTVAVFLATWVRNRLLSGVLALSFVGVFTGLWLYNNHVAPLPLPVQRTLCWLPGKWDPTTMRGANAAIEWRQEVWSQFMYTTFPEHPWFGQGIRHFPTEAEGRSLSDTELFAVTQRTHSGFFSALDHVGIVGTAALILASLRAYWNCAFLMVARRRHLTPWMVWLILLYLSQQGWYWMTGNFSTSFMPFTLYMCLLEAMRRQTEPRAGGPDAGGGNPSPVKAGTA
jgi:hypothetical protein